MILWCITNRSGKTDPIMVPRTGTMTLISPRCEGTMSDVFVQGGRGSKVVPAGTAGFIAESNSFRVASKHTGVANLFKLRPLRKGRGPSPILTDRFPRRSCL